MPRVVHITIFWSCLLAAACAHPDSGQSSADAGAPADPVAEREAADRPVVRPLPDQRRTVRRPPAPAEESDAGTSTTSTAPAAAQPITGATSSATREVTPDPMVRSYLPSTTSPGPSGTLATPPPAPTSPGAHR